MLERGRMTMIVATTMGTVAAFAGGPGGWSKQQPKQQPTYNAPGFAAESVLTISFDKIRAYAKKLHFDETRGAADELPVDFKRREIGTERAPLIRIQPETASYKLKERELQEGRIIARLKSEAEVPELGLGSGWTWWWVDKKGGKWRSVFIADSEKPGSRIALPEALTLIGSPHPPWRQAIAHFWVTRVDSGNRDPIWVESWGTCGGCCRQRLLVMTPEP